MTSGWWIFIYLIGGLIGFVIFEFVQLARRRGGNESALTFSQFVTRMAEKSRGWAWFTLLFAVFVLLVGVWLIFHLEGLCTLFGKFCEIDI